MKTLLLFPQILPPSCTAALLHSCVEMKEPCRVLLKTNNRTRLGDDDDDDDDNDTDDDARR